MKSDELLSILAKHPLVGKLGKRLLQPKESVLQAGGLCCSAMPLLLAALQKRCGPLPPLLIVMRDAEEAGYFYHDLVQMLGDQDVLFFPSSYRRAIKYNQRDSANEILRTEVLGRLAGSGVPMIVTCPEALAEKVVDKRQMKEATLTLRQGSVVDFSELEDRLDELGFEHVDYVYEPGQYAIRGSIVDVFSYSSEWPLRIDFFGDEVDSVRSFDVQSQLSQQSVTEAVIVPAMTNQTLTYISLFDFLPEQTMLVCHEPLYISERVRQIYGEGFTTQALAEDAEAARFDLKAMLTAPDEFDAGLMRMRRLELQGKSPAFAFKTSPQPLFHKDFKLVEQACAEWQKQGYRLLMFSDSGKQLERLHDIFGAFEQPVQFDDVNTAIHEGYIDHDLKICLLTDHQIFDRFHRFNLRSDKARKGKMALTLKELQQFEVGDYVVHMDHGIGRFGGLVNVPSEDGTHLQEMIKIVYQNEDAIYVSIHALQKISKYKGKDGLPPRISRLGTGAWERMKNRVKTKVKDIARDLIKLYAQRQQEKGFAYSRDTYLQHELESSFIYEDTPDQLKATNDVKADMERQQPMDRLVCGDVGFGKTEIAVRAAFKAATDNKQTALLVPTTVLAYQHYQTFASRLKNFPVRVDYLTRARTSKEEKEILAALADGKIDIIIGTHKLIGKGVQFHDLGLLIIDEEQKFGVSVKEKLRQMRTSVDTLTMTATPIPRTLQFSLMGARDLSVIQTPPPNRLPIQTEIHTFSAEIIAEAINFELSRNGQVFFVNNRISDLPRLASIISREVPDARVAIGHGQMDPKELEKIIFDFMNHDYDVLLSTTIVENGVDIPNANTIIINNAHTYGLSDLHQMRGRVGRSNKKAFCYLLAPPLAALPDDSRRRLQAVETFSELGSGLSIAMQDLDIRGAGNMLGAEQSGFIADLGYETYQKVLAEAVAEIKLSDDVAPIVKEDASEWVAETTVESDIQAYFPESYVPSSGERMALYRELDGLTEQPMLEAYRKRLIDRFGPLPPEGEELLRVMPMKWTAARLGIERIVLKRKNLEKDVDKPADYHPCMMCFMVGDRTSIYYQSRAFGHIINYATTHYHECQFQDNKHPMLLVPDVTSIKQALTILQNIENTPV